MGLFYWSVPLFVDAMRGYYESKTPPTVVYYSSIFRNFAVCFVHGLKMYMWLIIRNIWRTKN